MRLFACDRCDNPVHFDNTVCLGCGRRLGYRPEAFAMAALEPLSDGRWTVSADGSDRFLCTNAEVDACNWLLEPGAAPGPCRACRHNRTIPDLSVAADLDAFRRIVLAERQLFYSLMRWRLAAPTRAEDAAAGLAFDFLAAEIGPDGTPVPVVTGHADGIITLATAEADDVERESRRTTLGEPYRTLLGHFRHEIGHYYWDRLVRDADRLDAFRAVFGDERRDYGEALAAHYRDGPRPDWAAAHVSAYASCHPWEDFAETWAHCLHMVDALETARGFGLGLRPRLPDPGGLAFDLDVSPYATDRARVLVDAFVPLTVAVNAINRSMGQPDLYPFVLSEPVVDKIGFVLSLIHADHVSTPASRDDPRATAAATTDASTESATGLETTGASAPAGSSMVVRWAPVNTTISIASAARAAIRAEAVDRCRNQSTTATVGRKPRSSSVASASSLATSTRAAPSLMRRVSRSKAMIGSSSTTRAVQSPRMISSSLVIGNLSSDVPRRASGACGAALSLAPPADALKNDTRRDGRRMGEDER